MAGNIDTTAPEPPPDGKLANGIDTPHIFVASNIPGPDMIRAKAKYWICLFGLGCTGTDYIADPPVTVEPELQPSLVVTPDMAAVEVGASQALEAVYLDEMGNAVADVVIIWMVSDEDIASVDETGLVSGRSEGQVNVTAHVGDTVSDAVMVAVVADPNDVALVRVSPATFELSLDDSRQLTALSISSGGNVLEKSFVWRSSNEAVATVDDAGQVTAIAPGVALISAETDGVTSNSVRVTVPGSGRMGVFQPKPESTYDCEGDVVLQETDSGGLEIVFGDDFLVSRGPRLAVFLSTTNAVGPGSLNLGDLQLNSGSQTYPVLEGTRIDDFDWVIIHCVPFNVTFGYAQLR